MNLSICYIMNEVMKDVIPLTIVLTVVTYGMIAHFTNKEKTFTN